jgi:TolB-like protein/Flp pilus assembly protein TadD
VVEESNLTVQISALRRILDAGSEGESCIQTVSGRGYRFVLPAAQLEELQSAIPAQAPADVPALPGTPSRPWPPRWHWLAVALAGMAIGVVVLVEAVGSWRVLHDRNAVAVPTVARPVAYSPEDRRRSVIILPFENSSGDSSQDSLATSFTRDLTSQIGRDSSVPVIPAATAAGYGGKTLDLRAIRRECNVHFAVEGNIRRANDRLIVAVNVFDTSDDRSVWSDRFDLPDTNQSWDYLLHGIADGYGQASVDAEFAHAMLEHPSDLDKRDLMFAASTSSLKTDTKDNYLKKLALLEQVLALDPNYVQALSTSARLATDYAMGGFSTDPKTDYLALASTRLDRALQLAPNDFDTLKHKSHLLRVQGDLDGATAMIKRLLEMNPVSGFRYFDLGLIRLIQGHPEELLTDMQTARRLASTGDPSDAQAIDAWLAMALFANGRFDEAISQAHLAVAGLSNDSGKIVEVPWLALISAQYFSGNDITAKAQLQMFLSSPRILSNLAAVKKQPTLAAIPRLLQALRGAGMPEG